MTLYSVICNTYSSLVRYIQNGSRTLCKRIITRNKPIRVHELLCIPKLYRVFSVLYKSDRIIYMYLFFLLKLTQLDYYTGNMNSKEYKKNWVINCI